MRVLAVYNIKGGVGKTTTAVNLAYLSAREGKRTLVWDLDPQGAASYYFRIRPKVAGFRRMLMRKRDLRLRVRGTDFDRLDLLPADFSYRNLDVLLYMTKKPKKRLRRMLKPLAESYDCLFLDCAPSISLVSEAVFVAADALIVPTIPTPLAVRSLDQLVAHLERMDRRRPVVLPFFCMVDRRRALHRSLCDGDSGRAGTFLDARIPVSSTVERMGERRLPLAAYAAASEPALAYESLWTEIKRRGQV